MINDGQTAALHKIIRNEVGLALRRPGQVQALIRFPRTIIIVDATAITRHFELLGVDNDAAAEIYTDDAMLEYVQSNERIRGRDNIIASRRAYPGRPTRSR